ncbi:molybdopterin dinucleotide binding domain-containing protein [Chloroflexota bacterium]
MIKSTCGLCSIDCGVLVHVDKGLGIANGDWIYIETKRGRIKQKTTLSADIDPRVVVADYGWWFPEDGPTDLYSWVKSNVNILTDNRPPFSREMATANLRDMMCKVYKV